jgi:hypothetical protein
MRRAVLIGLLLVAARPAQARDLWKSEDGQLVLEGRAFYKTFGAFLDVNEGGDAAAAISAHSARLWGRFAVGDALAFDLGWQLDASIASDALLSGVGGGIVPGAGVAVPSGRRLVDFDHGLISSGGFVVQHNLDLLSARVSLPKGELVVGRQVLSWGTGRFWNPTDLLSPFSPTDIDKEVRHGIDAVRYSLPLSTTSLIDVLWLPQQRAADQGGAIRAQWNVGGFDVSLSAAKYLSDVVFGADTAGDLGPFAVHGEAAYTLGLSGLGTNHPVVVAERFLRAVVGLDWKPTADLILSGEYYYNGFGATDPAAYLAKLSSDRVRSGEIFGVGRQYVGVGAVYKLTELLTLNASAITNLLDPSAVLVPVVEYWLEQSVILRAGGFIGLGRRPLPGPTLTSEYGATPSGLFLQAGLYF